MPALPSLASGAIARYPVNRAVLANTGVIQFVNGNEQRWRQQAKLVAFDFVYTDVNSYDMGVMLDFFLNSKGMFIDAALTNVFSVTIESTTYNYCVFDQDDFTETENTTNRYTFKLRIKQVRKS